MQLLYIEPFLYFFVNNLCENLQLDISMPDRESDSMNKANGVRANIKKISLFSHYVNDYIFLLLLR